MNTPPEQLPVMETAVFRSTDELVTRLAEQFYIHVQLRQSACYTCRCSDLTEADARDALLEFVAEKCCYGKSAAEDLQIVEVKPSCAFHVSLQQLTYIKFLN